MALHIKSTKSFKLLLGFSALLISGMAATFSITGIATLFAGYFFTVALMMGALEFAKIVVASFLARYWSSVSKILRGYFIAALIVLILITSSGIFGYLSDAYQKTKGDYTLIEKNVQLIDIKIKLFASEKDRYQNRIDALIGAKSGQESRLDSLYSRGQTRIANRVEIQSKAYDAEINELSKKLNDVNDSIGVYETKKVEKESVNISGELGPLRYISIIFNTDMDTVVKYFIFLLIFVFDPLAVLLFVSLNTLIRKEHLDEEMKQTTEKDKDKDKDTLMHIEAMPADKNAFIMKPEKTKDANDKDTYVKQAQEQTLQDIEVKKKAVNNDSEEFVNELIQVLEKSKEPEIETPKKDNDEQEFHHDDKKDNAGKPILWHSANYHP